MTHPANRFAMQVSRSALILGSIIAPVSSVAWAWGDLGHEVVADIAEQKLTEEGKKFIFEILGGEPLSVAATFPDAVRSDERYGSFAPYHFVEIPAGLTAETLTPELRPKKDAHVLIEGAPLKLIDAATTRDEKILLLRYLVHVVGDVHQPLHVGNGVDLGGNLCKVRYAGAYGGKPSISNLHSVWDSKLIDFVSKETKEADPSLKWIGYKEVASYLLANSKKIIKTKKAKELASLTEANPLTWYDESKALHGLVYPDKVKGVKAEDREYCGVKGQQPKTIPEASIPDLDAKYVKKAVPVIKQRLLLGGLRLAHLINAMASDNQAEATQKLNELELLHSVQLENEHGK